ncbi:MAG: Cna B-type domain-containing protein [Ruminococcus sp.]|nr:Cna B-type domain-containing protein [Ruminococcus sp.]
MNRLTEGIKAFLYDSRKKGARSAAAAVLAAAVMLSVVAGLVRPAVSMTGSVEFTEITGPVLYASGDAFTIPTTGETPNGSKIDDATANVNKNDSGDEVTGEFDGHTVYQSKIDISLIVGRDDVKTFFDPSTGKGSIVFDLFTGGGVPSDFYTGTGPGENAEEISGPVNATDNSGVIGQYVFDFANNKGRIEFDSEKNPGFFFKTNNGEVVLDENGNPVLKDSGINATIGFEAWCWNDDYSANDRIIEIAGQQVKIPLSEYGKTYDIDVEKKYNQDLNGTNASFGISISSQNGVKGEIAVIDEFESDTMEFDLHEGDSIVIPENGAVLTVKGIISSDKKQTLQATITPPEGSPDLFKNGFSFDWNCPVKVKSDYVDSSGKVTSTYVGGKNKVTASAGTVTDETPDIIFSENTKVGVHKSGRYDPEDNTITWTVSLTKSNGKWLYGKIELDDFLGADENAAHPELAGDPVIERISPANSGNDGQTSLTYENGTFTVEFANTEPYDDNGVTKSANKFKAEEIVFTYKTKVSAEDYGGSVDNIAKMKDPENPGSYNTDTGLVTERITNPTVSKSGSYEDVGTDGTTGQIIWTITVNNGSRQELGGLKLTDTETWKKDGSSSNGIPDGSYTLIGSSGSEITCTVSGGVLTFPEGARDSSYTLTYNQNIDRTQAKETTYSNKTELKTPEGKKLSESETPVDIPGDYGVEKSGRLADDGSAAYTIRLENKYGTEVEDTEFTDVFSVPKNWRISDDNVYLAENYDFNVTGANKVENFNGELAEGLNYYITVSGDTATLHFMYKGTTTGDITVGYSVKPKEAIQANQDIRELIGLDLNNTVNWNGKTDSEHLNVSQQQYSLSDKQASYDGKTNTITWSFTVNNPNGIDLSKTSKITDKNSGVEFDGRVVFDTMFEEGMDLKIYVDGDQTPHAASEYGTYDGTSVIKGKTYGRFKFNEGSTAKSYRFEYKTKAEKSYQSSDWNTDPETHEVNTVRFGNEEKTKIVNRNDMNGLVKKVDKQELYWTSWNGNTKIKHWVTDVKTYEGGFLEYPITDSLSLTLVKSDNTETALSAEGIEHYMTAAQCSFSGMTITARDNNNNGVTADLSTLFDLEPAGAEGRYTGFTLKAKTGLSEENESILKSIVSLSIQYETTFVGKDQIYKAEEIGSGESVRFRNTVEFAGSSDNDNYEDLKKEKGIRKLADNINGSVELRDLEHHDGYYYISYRLKVNENSVYDASTLVSAVDTLPLKFEFDSASYVDNTQNSALSENGSETQLGYQLGDEDGHKTVTFYIPGDVHQGRSADITYKVKISEEDIRSAMKNAEDPAYRALNRAEFDNRVDFDGTFDTAPVTVINSDSGLTKGGKVIEDQYKNIVEYTLDINEEREDLSPDSDTVVLTDIFNGHNNQTSSAENPILIEDIGYDNIKVYEVKEDGSEVELDGKLYKMEKPVKSNVDVVAVWEQSQGNPRGKGDVYSFSMELPDNMHIKIVYRYSFELNQWAVNYGMTGKSLTLTNYARIGSQTSGKTDETRVESVKKVSSSGTASIAPYLNLRKISSQNWNNTLEGAKFKLWRMDKNGDITCLTSIKSLDSIKFIHDDGTTENTTAKLGIFGEGDPEILKTDKNGKLDLPTLMDLDESVSPNQIKYNHDYLYWLEEIESPHGYYLTDKTIKYFFYEVPEGKTATAVKPGSAINEAVKQGLTTEDNIHPLMARSTIELKNDMMELDVEKTWLDAPGEDLDEITVDLWASDTKTEEFDTTGKTPIQTLKLKKSDNWKGSFDTSELDSTKYYYITEEEVPGYYASYTETGLRNGTFKLENKKIDLDIQKYWNDPYTEAKPKDVKVDIYESDVKPADRNVHLVTVHLYDTANRDYGTYAYSVKDNSDFKFDVVFSNPATNSEYIQYREGVQDRNNEAYESKTCYYDNNTHKYSFFFESTEKITKDRELAVQFGNMTNNDVFYSINVVDESVLEHNTSSGVDTTDTEHFTKITDEPIVLTAANSWHSDLNGLIFHENKYYYAVEQTNEKYTVDYLLNGVSREGTMKLINNDKPSGNIEVKKAWLTEELAQGKTKVDYTIYGYALDSAPAAQPASEYSQDSGVEVYVKINDQSESYKYALEKKFIGQIGKTYVVTYSGRNDLNVQNDGFYVNGQWTRTISKDGNTVTLKFTINNTDQDGKVKVVSNVWYSSGTEEYSMVCTEENNPNNIITMIGSDASFGGNKTYPAVTVKRPTDADPVVTENLTVEKGNDDSWTGVLSGLPLTDENGKKIYYYVVEKTSNDYVPIDYSDNGFALEAKETNSVTVTNGPNNSPPSYELPESGGEGTARFLAAGGALMLGAAMYYIIRKRKASA